MKIVYFLPALAALLFVAASAWAADPTAITADGQTLSAALIAADAQWQLTFSSGDKRQTMPAAELVRWGTFAEPARGPVLVLADGGLLPAEVVKIDKERLTADSDLLGTLKIPLESLSGILFRLPAGAAARDRLLGRILRPGRGDSDRLLLDNGDAVTGLVEGLDGDTLRLTADVGPTDVAVRRILAVLFAPVAKQPPPRQDFRAWVGLSDGSRLLAGKLILSGGSLELTTAAGQTWKAAAGDLVALQPLGGRTVYLSDLKPAAYRHVPYLNLSWPYHTDRNVTDGLLLLRRPALFEGAWRPQRRPTQLCPRRIVSPF